MKTTLASTEKTGMNQHFTLAVAANISAPDGAGGGDGFNQPMKGQQPMKSKSNSDHVARATNFKRPCWLALFASVGAMLAGGSSYWIFPGNEVTSDPPLWQTRTESALFVLMVVGVLGFVASLLWWCVADIEFRHLISRSQPTSVRPAFSALGLVSQDMAIRAQAFARLLAHRFSWLRDCVWPQTKCH